MYKLTVISGPNRGSSYPVQEGELSIGRQSGNSIVLASSKVSKRHCVLIMNQGEVIIRDEGSSNGTFVNGILTKVRKLKIGDRISVGDFVLELVEPPKKSMMSAPAIAGLGNVFQLPGDGPGNGMDSSGPGGSALMGASGLGSSEHQIANQVPTDLKGKILWHFENQVMPIFYGLNLKYEWKSIYIYFVAVFIIGNLIISVYPLLESNRIAIIKETALRAKFMAKQIAEQNAPYLAARAETKTDIGNIENAESVRLALLVDLDNRILAPGAKMNQYLTNGGEANIAVKAKNLFRSGRETGITAEVDSSTVMAIEPVKILNPNVGRNIVVAMAIVSLDTSLSTPDLGEMGIIYSQNLILTGLLGGILFFIFYRLTLKPFHTLNEDIDKALKGDLPHVTHQFQLEELDSLWDVINSAIQRVPKSNAPSDGVGGNQVSSEEYVGPLRMIGSVSKFGLVAFDSDKKIIELNPVFEEMSGIRLDAAVGHDIADVARDQALAAFTNDILSRVYLGGEGISEDFDFSGITYKIYANGFGSSGGIARCYVLLAVKAEG